MESAAPGAGELAGQLAAQLSTPAVAAAALAALFTTGLMLGVGLVLALLPAGDSLFLLSDGSVINQMLVNAAAFTSAPLTAGGGAVQASFQTMPMIFILLPLGGMAFFMAAQGSRLELLSPGRRLIVGAAGAIPLALLLLIVALSGKIDEVKPEVGPVVLLALLWGGLGGLLGAWWTLRDQAPDVLTGLVPPAAHAPLRACGAVVRPLFVALVLTTVVGTTIVTIQTLRDAGDVQASRSGIGATIENALYAPEHGVHVFELGSFVQFKTSAALSFQLPIPVDSPEKLFDARASERETATELTFRIFDYSDAVPSWLFILGLLGLIAIPLLFAIYAGFAAARVANAQTPQNAVAFGSLTGPVWAIIMAIVNAVATKTDQLPLWGAADSASVFGFSLLIGGALGAVGGLLAVQRQPGVATPTMATPPA